MHRPEHLTCEDPLQRHPPERGRRNQECIVLYSCCCCCCCCLHTIGGVIGAFAGGDYQADIDAPSSQAMYWKSFLIAVIIGTVVALAVWGPQGLVGMGAALIILGPAWMLAASLIMLVWIFLRHDLPSREEYLRKVGSISAGIVGGTVVGIGIMYLAFLAISA